MNRAERIAWLREQAAQILEREPPQTEPNEWTGGQAVAAVLIDWADRMEASDDAA
ncbi:MAG TPA: hypothetical protein VFE72_12125 [Lysobacter sp.]|nr:hypothetical protein [Lysobacter sp.]